ncbi:synaptic vesicle glycoprotein 2C-like [Hydra vulgaris]|uniref:Synaptic vesicle glycoprotein 2C-like n=1 Tax=Hydra vulgaris TaxID=6087 RepID=A0ABM4BVT1_HYDVU
MYSSHDPQESDINNSETKSLLKEENVVYDEADLYENAVASCGFGYFQIKLLFICGWAIASDSAEIQTVSFVLPSACDLYLTSNNKGWLNAIIFIGMILGGYGFGGAADIKGRRFILLMSMSLNGLFGVCSAFSPSFGYFLIFRLLSGIGVGAAMPVLFSYFVEFMSMNRRGPMIGFMASFWMFGNILASAAAWIIIPRVHIGFYIFGLWFGSWRIFVVICAIPSLSSALFLYFMPESPKYLQNIGQYKRAEKVFTLMFCSNFGQIESIPPEISEFGDKQPRVVTPFDINHGDVCKFSQCLCSFSLTLQKVCCSTKKLFQKPHLRTTLILLFVWFTLSFGYYGLWMWFPEIFQRIQQGGSSCGGETSFNETKSIWTCSQQVEFGTAVYMESFLIALSNLPGNIITVLVINKLGRRQLLAISMVISGICVFFFWFVTTPTETLIMACLFSGVSVAGWNALDALALEQYPTNLRSTSFGLQSGVGRVAAVLGNVVFGEMVDLHCSIPLLTVAVMLFIGGLSAIKLQKTEKTALK